jgi:hypothetical protein
MKKSEIHAVNSQTHVCSVKARQPSASSRRKSGAAARPAAAGQPDRGE